MTSWKKQLVGLVLVSGVLSIGVSACADNETSIFIRQVQTPAASPACGYTADPSSEYYTMGKLDLAFRTEYVAGLLVGNQLVARGSSEQIRSESSRVRLEGSDVRIEKTDGSLIAQYSFPAAGFADAASGTQPGWGMVTTVLVNSETGKALASTFTAGERSATVGRIVAVVKVFGKTLGGQDVQSGEFRFPIEVCYGCLVSFPAGAYEPTAGPPPNCMNLGETGTGAEDPCFLGQDTQVDCRVCHSSGFSDGLCEP